MGSLRYACSQNPHIRSVCCGFSSFASLEIASLYAFLDYIDYILSENRLELRLSVVSAISFLYLLVILFLGLEVYSDVSVEPEFLL